MDWEENFDRCSPWIEAALVYADGSHTLDDVRVGIQTGRYQFFSCETGFAITEIVTTPRKLVLSYFLAGGDLKTFEEYEPVIEQWARNEGCDRIEFTGRRGWLRSFLRDRGYGNELITLSKELNDGESEG